jgi:hypothetical protein
MRLSFLRAVCICVAAIVFYTVSPCQFSGEKRWDGTYNDEAYACTVDHHGDTIVVGRSRTGSLLTLNAHWRFSTVKYSHAGTLLWQKYYDGPSGDDSYATAVAVDAQDNVYVAGVITIGTPGLPPSATHFAVVSYEPTAGSTVWPSSGAHTGYSFYNGGVYLNDSGFDGSDFFSTGGSVTATERCALALRPGSSQGDFTLALAGPTNGHSSNQCWRTIVFEDDNGGGDGVRLRSGWPIEKFGDKDPDTPYGVGVGTDDSIYVVGAHHDAFLDEYLTAIHYQPDGSDDVDPEIWLYEYTGGGKPNKGLAIALDHGDNAFVTGLVGGGSGSTVRYFTQKILRDPDGSGDPQTPWTNPAFYDTVYDDKATTISLSFEKESGAMQTYAYVSGVSGSNITTVRYKDTSTAGTQQWTDSVTGDSSITGLAAPRMPHVEAIGRGNAYVVGRSSANSGDYSLTIYDKTGSKRASTTATYDNLGVDEGRWCALGGAGLVFYTGFSLAHDDNDPPSPTTNDFLTLCNNESSGVTTFYLSDGFDLLNGSQVADMDYGYYLAPSSGHIDIVVGTCITTSNPSEIRLDFTDFASTTGVNRKIYLQDRVNSVWELVSDSAASTSSQLIRVALRDDPAKYLDSGGNMSIKVSYYKSGSYTVQFQCDWKALGA